MINKMKHYKPKFKLGDKVRRTVTDHLYEGLRVGEEGTIKSFCHTGGIEMCKLKETGDKMHCLERLELITQRKEWTGRVTIKDNRNFIPLNTSLWLILCFLSGCLTTLFIMMVTK